MFKKILLGLIVLGIILTIFWLRRSGEEARFETVPVKRGRIISSVSATGKVISSNLVNIGTEVSGTIRRVHVEPNDQVDSGAVLAELDREKFKAAYSEAESRVGAARAELRRSSAMLEKARADFSRISRLFEKGLASKSEFDTAKSELEGMEAGHEKSGAELRNAEATLRAAKDDLGKTVIKSPIKGTVLTVDVQEGQTVAASFQTPILLAVADLARMEVHANVDEADIGGVRKGQEAIFYVDSYPDREFRAKVDKIYYSPTIEQNVVTYETVLGVPNKEMLLRQGMTANVRIITARSEDVLLIPNEALRVRLEKRGEKERPAAPKGPSVWVLAEGRPEKRPITIGTSNEEFTQIINGVSEGEEVVVESPLEPKRPRRRMFGF